MSTALFPIVVVGAGPVGLSVALGLLRQGYHVLVFEQRSELADDPRGTTLQPPTLEMLQHLGVLEAIEARSRRVDRVQYWAWDAKRPERLADLDLGLLADDTPHPFRLHCAQPDLCRELHAAIEAIAPGTVHLGQKVAELHDRGDCVDVEIDERGRTRRIRASWLCGADGVGSGVRRKLELPVRRMSRPDVFFTCETDLAIDDALERRYGVRLGDAAFLFTDRGWALFMRMQHSARLLFLASENHTSESLHAMTRALYGADPHVQIGHRGVYAVQQQVAETWRKGRVLVLGDAAHTTFPVSGTAMNSGIQDGYALAQALPKGEEGVAAWEVERRTEVHARVNAFAGEAYRTLGATGLFTRFGRDRHLRAVSANAAAARNHLLRASMMEGRAGPVPELEAD
ncbi:MAG: FAD-dependent monooxygenase [Alphaproteobacteria bacterium]|nr:FAD-dependent monooxygenase [Alphaproteobacteria bacterium]